MRVRSTSLHLETPEDTDRLGQTLARDAQAGDCLLLSGQIGAGKSALARSFIRTLVGANTEVPSPTFTLVQTYETASFEIWHADLYRLSDPQEVVELGLVDAFENSVCLIEWPDLLGEMVPETALQIKLSVDGDGRAAVLTYGAEWNDRMAAI